MDNLKIKGISKISFLSIIFMVFLFSTVTAQLSNKIAINSEEGLIAYYPFNGNVNDESGNKQHTLMVLPISKFRQNYL